MAEFGINGESTGRLERVWSRGQYNNSLSAIVEFVDTFDSTSDESGITIIINDEVSFRDANDGQGPVRQRAAAVAALQSELGRLEIEESQITNTLARLREALAPNRPGTRYDISRIRAILIDRGLTLEQIASISAGPGVNADGVIGSLLESLELNPRQYETRVIQSFDELQTSLENLSAEQIQANPAFQAFGQAGSLTNLSQEQQQVITAARQRLQTLEQQAQAEAARPSREERISELRREISNASLENLQSIVRDSARRELLRENRDLLTDRVQTLIAEDSNLSAQAIRDLTPYLALERGQAIISFLQDDQEHIAIITQTERGWAFESDQFTDLRISVDDDNLVVREDRVFGHRFRTVVIATRGDSATNHSAEQTLFNLGVSMETRDVLSEMNPALSRRIDRDGDGGLSDEELRQFHDMVTRYANDHGISVDRAYELYRTSTSFRFDNFAARGAARERIITELTEGNDEADGINFNSLASMSSSDEARTALASGLEQLGYDQPIIAAALDQHQGSYQNITAEMMASYFIRISSAAMHGPEFFNVETSIPEFSAGLVTARAIWTYLHGEDYDEPLALASSAGDVRAAARRLERDPRFREKFYNVTHYRNIANWERLATELAGTLMNSDNPEDHEIAELLPQILEIYGGPDYAASVLQGDAGYNSTMANRYTRLGNYDRAYHYAQRITDRQEIERTLRSLVGDCMSGNRSTMTRVARLDLANTILRSEIYSYDDREERLLRLVRDYNTMLDVRTPEQASAAESTSTNPRQLEVRHTAIEILEWMRNENGLGYGEDRMIQVPGSRQEMALQDYIIQLQDEQAMPLEIMSIRRSVLSRGGEPRIERIPAAMRQLYEIYQREDQLINQLEDQVIGSATSSTDADMDFSNLHSAEILQHRVTRAYAARVMSELARALRDRQWNEIPYELSQRGTSPNFRDSQCYQTTILMARLARQAAIEFEELAGLDEGRRRLFGNESQTANSVTADVVYDVAELYAGRNDGNPQGLHAHEAYRNHYRRAFQDVARYLLPNKQCRITNRRGEEEEIETRTVRRRVGLPLGEAWPNDEDYGFPPITDIQAVSELSGSIVRGGIVEMREGLNGLQRLRRAQAETRTRLLSEMQSLEERVEGQDEIDEATRDEFSRIRTEYRQLTSTRRRRVRRARRQQSAPQPQAEQTSQRPRSAQQPRAERRPARRRQPAPRPTEEQSPAEQPPRSARRQTRLSAEDVPNI